MTYSTYFTAVAALAAGASAQLYPRDNSTASGILGSGASGIISATSSVPIGTGVTSALPISTGSSNATSVVPSATLSSNGTSTSTAAAEPTASDPTFCPALSGELYVGPLDVTYSISCDVSYGGIEIDINIAKRQASNATSLQDCLDVCSALDTCVATAYDTNNPSCVFYSSTGDAINMNGIEFAEVAARGNTNTTSSSSLPTGTAAASGTGASIPMSSATDAPYPTGNNSTASAGPTGGSTTPMSSMSSTSGTTSASGTIPSGTTSSTSPATTSAATDLFCPNLNAQVFIDSTSVEFIIECGTAHFGVTIDITIAKRQAIAGESSLGDCITLCANNDACVGTAFNTVAGTCTLYSSIGAAYNDPNVEFAVKVAPEATATAGQTLTVPVYQTNVVTVSSCAPTVTDCPLDAGSVVTQTVIVASTDYVCPTATTYPGSVIACTGCPYAAVTATAYSTTTVVIKSCAPTVTNCPYNSNGVKTAGAVATGGSGSGSGSGSGTVTDVAVVTTTVTTCPVGYTLTTGGSTIVLTTPSAITTVITSTGSGSGSGSSESGVTDVTKTTVYAVGTTVVNYPLPTSTGEAATATASVVTTVASASGAGSTAGAGSGSGSGAGSGSSAGAGSSSGSTAGAGSGSGSGAAGTTTTGSSASATTSGVLAYTGAATQLTAGGVAGALVAGLAFML